MSAEAAMQLWPQLRDAVQPAPIERRSFSGQFKVAAEWAALVQRVERGEFRLRAPAASTRHLCGPIVGHGPCLDPVFLSGDVYWIDPTMPAEDGDFVILQWDAAKLAGIVERGSRKPEWLAEYGPNPSDIASKWLRRFGNEYLTVTRRSSMPLGASPFWGGADRILGVVRYVERQGRPIYCSGLVAHNIDPEAATSTYTLTDSDQTNIPESGSGSYGLQFPSDIVEPVDCTVYVTISLNVDSPGGAVFTFEGEVNDAGVLSTLDQYNAPAGAQRVVFQFQLDVGAGDEWNIIFQAASAFGSGATADLSNIRVEVNVIRR
jgi:hypothetical protein